MQSDAKQLHTHNNPKLSSYLSGKLLQSARKHSAVVLSVNFDPLNAELNPICYLLALLAVHHFLHVSRIRVKSLTRRQLMSYICMTLVA